jgi:hypothetical protein
LGSIGSLSIKLSADPTGLHSALSVAEKKIGQFAGNASRLLLSPLTGVAKAAAVPTKAVESFLAPFQSLLTSLPLVGGALAAIPLTGAGFTAFIKEGISEITAIGAEADKLGVNVKSLSGLLAIAGGAGEALVHGFGHMERTISEASRGGKEASSVFEALGLSGEALAAMAPDQAFMAVAGAIKGMGSAYDRAAAAQDIFGKAGLEILPLLEKDLRKGADWADKMGISFDAGALALARDAAKAMRDIDAQITGLKRTLAIASAPFVEQIVKWFTQILDKSGGVKGAVVSMFDAMVKGLAPLLSGLTDMLNTLKEIHATLEPMAAGSGAREGGKSVAKFLGVGGPGPIFPNTHPDITPIGDLGEKLKDLWEKARKNLIGGPKPVSTGLFGIPAAVFDMPRKPLYDPDMAKRVMEFISKGESPFAKLGDQIRELNTIFQKGVISAARYQKGLEVVDDELRKLANIQKTPIETFFDQMKTVQDLKGLKAGGLANRLLGSSFLDLEKSLGTESAAPHAGAVIAGSAEDLSRNIALMKEGEAEQINIQVRIEQVLTQALGVHQAMLAEGQRISAALAQLNIVN